MDIVVQPPKEILLFLFGLPLLVLLLVAFLRTTWVNKVMPVLVVSLGCAVVFLVGFRPLHFG